MLQGRPTYDLLDEFIWLTTEAAAKNAFKMAALLTASRLHGADKVTAKTTIQFIMLIANRQIINLVCLLVVSTLRAITAIIHSDRKDHRCKQLRRHQ